MFEKNSDFIVNVVDHMTDEDLEEINFPIISIEVGIWSPLSIIW